MLKMNGAARVVVVANKGIKMELAKELGAGDEYVELERGEGNVKESQWERLRKENPYGFDVVVSEFSYLSMFVLRRGCTDVVPSE